MDRFGRKPISNAPMTSMRRCGRFDSESSQALAAFIGRRSFTGESYQVELRPSPPGRHPLSGERIESQPLAILWSGVNVLALLVDRAIVAAGRADPSMLVQLLDVTRFSDLTVDFTEERNLWRLLSPARATGTQPELC